MGDVASSRSEQRLPLSRERVLRTAVAIADEHGIETVTMRRVGDELGAEAMSLYHHVANKDALLDGAVDLVVREINEAVDELDAGGDWQVAVRTRILAARAVLLRHRWASRLLSTRAATSPEVVRYHDRLVGLLRAGGFSFDLAHHALHALGSRAMGFSQELFDPGDGGSADSLPPEVAAELPNLVAMLSEIAHDDPASTLGWCDDQTEFEFGLDLLLDGLDRRRVATTP
ncbi:TetR/AcrR family transcriptional regulator [Cellulomonas humilata]|uniref:TetR/AcrR family transcriptional regulator n=1 Tax=Cellulomonas humilata TaxID=144055 RepID=A0A7Y6DXG1_9CELL|nr:TetR/AcrR family transcriptional regulator C-terminal domain-containing protein [Cellulomonas humilata]NUU16914.1 TetR/AcrR family transcriptional regulator [Cellulomonas humilata]